LSPESAGGDATFLPAEDLSQFGIDPRRWTIDPAVAKAMLLRGR
jgi:hypothetical protein